jgi:hypothetical protein
MPGMQVSTTMSGQCMGTPDTCQVPAPPAPPVPTPFPNMGMLMTAQSPSTKVKVMNKEVILETSKISQSMGDEAGVAGGVVSGMNMGEIAFKMGSAKVKIEGKKPVYMSCTTAHNGSNANMPAGTVIAPSQTMVTVAP